MSTRLEITLKISLSFIAFFFLSLSCSPSHPQTKVGLDAVRQYRHLFEGKRVGIVTNHSAVASDGQHIIDIFSKMPGVEISALFGPEHGIKGGTQAGAVVASDTSQAGYPVFSLYGKARKPTPKMLANVDVLVFDIQDVGARYYTYLYTMTFCMEAAAENGIAFVVLDRPNPLNGATTEGNLLQPEFATFVGMYPIPVRYAMTIGELARLINEEGWLNNRLTAKLTVVPLQNWQRKMWYDETGLTFIKPSPNMPDMNSVIAYPGLCLIEGVNVSEGRGTMMPFQLFGAPWIESNMLRAKLEALNLAGVSFFDTTFVPKSIAGMAEKPKYENQKCHGLCIRITDRSTFQSYYTGIQIVKSIYEMYPDSLVWFESHFDRLCGTDKIRGAIMEGGKIEMLYKSWQSQLQQFDKLRRKYLLYE